MAFIGEQIAAGLTPNCANRRDLYTRQCYKVGAVGSRQSDNSASLSFLSLLRTVFDAEKQQHNVWQTVECQNEQTKTHKPTRLTARNIKSGDGGLQEKKRAGQRTANQGKPHTIVPFLITVFLQNDKGNKIQNQPNHPPFRNNHDSRFKAKPFTGLPERYCSDRTPSCVSRKDSESIPYHRQHSGCNPE